MADSINRCPNCGVQLKFNREGKGMVTCPRCRFRGPIAAYHRVGFCPDCNQRVAIINPQSSTVYCPKCGNVNQVSKINFDPQPPTPAPTPGLQPPPQPVGGNRGGNGNQVGFDNSGQNGVGGRPVPDAGRLGQTSDSDMSTRIFDPNALAGMRPGSLVIEQDGGKWVGTKYPILLKMGVNIIGRSAMQSKADIMLPTQDMTMSKHHVCIEMVRRPNGRIEHILSDIGSTNGTYYQNTRIEPGEKVVIEDGGLIRMGNTVMKFRIMDRV